VLILWQAEWCPYSARVREALTEYGVDFVAKQVPAEKANRGAMREATGTEEIPLLVREDGSQLDDWQGMLEWIRSTYERRDDADRHREKWFEEAPLRDPKHVLT
jgi:glutaredoxin